MAILTPKLHTTYICTVSKTVHGQGKWTCSGNSEIVEFSGKIFVTE